MFNWILRFIQNVQLFYTLGKYMQAVNKYRELEEKAKKEAEEQDIKLRGLVQISDGSKWYSALDLIREDIFCEVVMNNRLKVESDFEFEQPTDQVFFMMDHLWNCQN